jgi:uncharacterized glyoxalase superfamily metalloenzyme YdcJ
MAFVEQWQLRGEFASRLSVMYGMEVPLYTTLLDVSQRVNHDVSRAQGVDAHRLGSIERVTAERHGAVRVGTPGELGQLADIFAALGMFPVGFYDLREAAGSAIPVVSTAFRPVDPGDLARNPFRVFTSLLVPSDRRFFSDDLRVRLENFLGTRELFSPELLNLAKRASAHHGLEHAEAQRFLGLATAAFELSSEPIDRGWYDELHAVSSVAADIGGVASTHINHLTPRVLDIDALYRRMVSRGIAMIDTIQGPPGWEGPDLLLRQTSFRALAEKRDFREADGRIVSTELQVRFGEVEARGIAVTPRGRALYDDMTVEVEQTLASTEGECVGVDARNDLAVVGWRRRVPRTETELLLNGIAYFTFRVNGTRPRDRPPPDNLKDLLDQGWLAADPIVYEDFLPKSAAGIFQSNLTSSGRIARDLPRVEIDAMWMDCVVGGQLHSPYDLYDDSQRRSLETAAAALGISRPLVMPAHTE